MPPVAVEASRLTSKVNSVVADGVEILSPGMLMSAKGLLLDDPRPDEKKIRKALSGNICRCTGYAKIVEAVEAVSEK